MRAWLRTVGFLMRKEALHVMRDRATMFQVLAIPIVQLLVLANVATFEIRDSRVHVVDLDRTAASRALVGRFVAAGAFRVVESTTSLDAADRDLIAGEADLVLAIPDGFEKDLVVRHRATVRLAIDAQQGAAAAIVRAYAGRIIQDFALGRSLERRGGVRLIAGEPRAPPTPGVPRLEISTRGWYNPLRDYQDYMVPGILVALVTIISALLSAQNIAREKEIGTLEQLNVTPLTRSQFIAGKLAPFWILALFEFCLGLAIAWWIFDVPLRGSVPLVVAVAALYLLTTLGIGLWISTVADTQQQANFVSFFILVIYLLMSGLFTPVDSMPRPLQVAAELNPLKHFVEVMRVVLVKGAGPGAIVVPVLALAAFAAVTLTGATLRYRKTTG